MRYRFIALPLAALASFALATVALGGGSAVVTVGGGPSDPVAGEETTIYLRVLQHGETPVSWPRLTVVATDTISGAVLRTEAQPKGPDGSYVASIVFPSAGEWTLTFDSVDLLMSGSAAIEVAPAQAAAQVTPVAATAQPSDMMPMVLLLIAAAVALAVFGLLLTGRRAADDSQVPART